MAKEFFVYTVSDPAPFCGDSDTFYKSGASAESVLGVVKRKYDHPAGLHYAAVYTSADAYHKGRQPVTEFSHKCQYK